MNNFETLKLKEQASYLKRQQQEMILACDYLPNSEQLRAYAEHLTYSIKSLEGLANENV